MKDAKTQRIEELLRQIAVACVPVMDEHWAAYVMRMAKVGQLYAEITRVRSTPANQVTGAGT